RPGKLGSITSSLIPLNGSLIFAADDRVHGVEPWRFTPPPDTVEKVVINDGSAQRSMVQSVTITFSGPVTLSAGAFELESADGASLAGILQVSSSLVNGKTVAVLTFSGAGIVGGS